MRPAPDDSRYIPAPSINQYFDAMGYTETAVDRSLSMLMEEGLLAPHDPSTGSLASGQRIAITHSGLTHLELALFNPTFFEQIALTAQMANPDAAAQVRHLYVTAGDLDWRLRKVRERFAGYLLQEDEAFGRVPTADQYKVQSVVSADIRKFAGGTSDADLTKRDATNARAEQGLVATQVAAVVDWFDKGKGYGFATVEELREAVFLHASVLEKSGIDSVHDGDVLQIDVARSYKGIAVSKVHKAEVKKPGAPLMEAIVVKLFEERGYGFVFVPKIGQDAFFHVSLFPENERGSLHVGARLRAEINSDPKGRGLQVRRVA
jgi:cold shock CspA family protein